MTRLTPALQRSALAELAAGDRHLRAALHDVGPPPFWTRPPGFETLVRFVTEQSVSLGAADAVLGRLEQACRPLTSASVASSGGLVYLAPLPNRPGSLGRLTSEGPTSVHCYPLTVPSTLKE